MTLADKIIELKPVNLFDYIKEVPELLDLQNTLQDKTWHTEGDVLIHTNMVLEKALPLALEVAQKNKNPADGVSIYVGALIHDFGKPYTTFKKKDKIVAYGHEGAGVSYARDFLRKHFPMFGYSRREWLLSLVEYHGHPKRLIDGGSKDLKFKKLSLEVNTEQVYSVEVADFLGRTGDPIERHLKALESFKAKCIDLSIWDKKYFIPGAEYMSHKTYKNHLWQVLFNNVNENDKKAQLSTLRKMGDEPFELMIMCGPPGCHAKGTGLLMYNGTVKKVENIQVGDKLMGPDSKYRSVLNLCRGEQEMVRIIPTKGSNFTVNLDHILSLKLSGKCYKNSVVNISVRNFLKWPKYKQERSKLYKVPVNFSSQLYTPVDPYILGLWLGDGTSVEPVFTTIDDNITDSIKEYANKSNLDVHITKDKTCKRIRLCGPGNGRFQKKTNHFFSFLRNNNLLGNKHIPKSYKITSRKKRLLLLAGLIDSDGYLCRGCFEIATISNKLKDDIFYLVRSLGFFVSCKKTYKKCQTGKGNWYYRILISGNTSIIPTRLKRKKATDRKQIKNVLVTSFTTELLKKDSYYGFSLTGDSLYLLDDFTVTHNSGKSTYRNTLYPHIEAICMDDERERLCGNVSDMSKNQEVYELCYKKFVNNMRVRKNTIWDATSIDRKMRKRLIDTARRHGAMISIVVFDIPIYEVLKRNQNRKRVVPEDVVYNYYRRFQSPKPYEYDKLYIVDEAIEFNSETKAYVGAENEKKSS